MNRLCTMLCKTINFTIFIYLAFSRPGYNYRVAIDKTNGKANGVFHEILRLLYSLSHLAFCLTLESVKPFSFLLYSHNAGSRCPKSEIPLKQSGNSFPAFHL